MENEKDYWFVKLCEDASPIVKVIKLKVLKLMRELRSALYKVGEDGKVFMRQFDTTCDYKGYFYCTDYKNFANEFAELDLKLASKKKYKSTSVCLQLVQNY